MLGPLRSSARAASLTRSFTSGRVCHSKVAVLGAAGGESWLGIVPVAREAPCARRKVKEGCDARGEKGRGKRRRWEDFFDVSLP
eukprot:scaffold3928_cov257-Pinguiococcus_pyrenoidosus.AAC.1